MVNSISNMNSMQGMIRMEPRALTDEQKSKIADILSEYDPENITEEDAKEIFSKFKEAGIEPARGMKEAIEEAGFDAEELRTLGMGEEGAPPPPPPSPGGQASKINSEGLQLLQSILNQYDLSNLTAEKEEELLSSLNQAGFMQSGSLLNISA